MAHTLPNDEWCSDGYEVDLYDVVVVAAPVYVVNHVFEDESKIVDRKGPGESIDDTDYEGDQEKEVDAASIEPTLQTL